MGNPWKLMAGLVGMSLAWYGGVMHAADRESPMQGSRPVFNVVDFGAVGDEETNNTAAFARAIEACSRAGGGMVYVPAGRFVIGAVFLRSHITLYIEAGCTILGSQNIDDYPVIDGRWEGVECKHYASVINGDGLENIAIVGRGTIDARGQFWWERFKDLPYARGRLIGLYRCTDVLIQGVTLRNSPAWTVNPIYCDNVTVDSVTVINPNPSPNTDGINPDSSRNVRISNCHIDVGDDCITIKSGRDEDGRRVGKPCENITITNCTMLRGHGGVVIGSEMSGGVNNVVISNCVFDGTENGIRMKTRRGRGGVVQDICVTNIVMRNVVYALKLNMSYDGQSPDYFLPTDPEPVSERTPAFRNIHISHIRIHGAERAAHWGGLVEMPLSEISLSHAVIDAKKGIYVMHGADLSFHDVRINTTEGPALYGEMVKNVEIDGLRTNRPLANTPVVELKQAAGVFLHDCSAVTGTDVYLRLTGAECRDIVLQGGYLSPAAKEVDFAEGAIPSECKRN